MDSGIRAAMVRNSGTSLARATRRGRFRLGASGRGAGGISVNGWARIGVSAVIAAGLLVQGQAARAFDYRRLVDGALPTLSVFVQSQATDGTVTLNGVDTAQPTRPFTFDFGDGTSVVGWFPQVHRYGDLRRNYVATVTANYGSGGDSALAVLRFAAPVLTPANLPPALAVTVADRTPVLANYSGRVLTAFDETSFTAAMPRAAIEQVLSAAAAIGNELVDGNLRTVDGSFRQLVVRDDSFGGAYALWFTNPVAVAVGPSLLRAPIAWSSLFHEIEHNLTLNMPAGFVYGGHTDGDASTLYSETMAQIFQHVAGHQLVNNAARYGLPGDLAAEIAIDLTRTATVLRAGHDRYLAGGRVYVDWNDHAGAGDPTLPTFMALAWRFLVHAENDGLGHRVPFRRMTRLLQQLDAGWSARYAGNSNAAAASAFRATLMVAALSYGFSADLRGEFRSLGFPVDDAIHAEVLGRVDPAVTALHEVTNCILAWGESSFPELLAPPRSATLSQGGYIFRHYGGTDLYLGVSSFDRHLYYLMGGQLGDLGAIAEWMVASGCR